MWFTSEQVNAASGEVDPIYLTGCDRSNSQVYVTGAIHKCTTKAFFVSDLQSDLLGGRALVTANYRVILDKDPKYL